MGNSGSRFEFLQEHHSAHGLHSLRPVHVEPQLLRYLRGLLRGLVVYVEPQRFVQIGYALCATRSLQLLHQTRVGTVFEA